MNKETEGVIIALDGKIAKVRASRHSDCESCGLCPGDSATVMDVMNQVQAKPGQRVIIEVPEEKMVKVAFVVYFLPLITTFIGFLIGMWVAQKYGFPTLLSEISASVIAFVLTLLYIKYLDRSMSKTRMLPVIKTVISEK